MPSEVSAVDQWIYNTLVNDPVIQALVGDRVYDTTVPEEGNFPCVIFAYIDGDDIRGTGGKRLAVWFRYRIEGMAESRTYDPVRPISNQIDTLLNLDQLATVDTVAGIARTSEVKRDEPEDGRVALGGIYEGMAYIVE